MPWTSTVGTYPDLTVGDGPHVCIGVQLAQLEARVLVDVLREDFPERRTRGPDPSPARGSSSPPGRTTPTGRSGSYSNGAACVEVAPGPDAVLVRDSKDRTGPTLTVPTTTWRAILTTVTR